MNFTTEYTSFIIGSIPNTIHATYIIIFKVIAWNSDMYSMFNVHCIKLHAIFELRLYVFYGFDAIVGKPLKKNLAYSSSFLESSIGIDSF